MSLAAASADKAMGSSALKAEQADQRATRKQMNNLITQSSFPSDMNPNRN
jgi:hypothetical protein